MDQFDIPIDQLPPALAPSREAAIPSMLAGLAEQLSVEQILGLIGASDVPMGEAVFVADHAFTAPDSGKMAVFNKATAVSGTLPPLAGTANEVYFARNIGAGALTIDPNGAETIEGAATIVLSTGTTAMIWPDATKAAWRVVRIARSELDRVNVSGANIASAATVDLSTATGDDVTITGVAAISGFGAAPAGVRRHLTFAGAATVVYNAVSMLLPGSANVVAASGDTAEVVSLGSGNWRMTRYTKVSGKGIAVLGAVRIQTFTASGTYTPHAKLISYDMICGGGGGGGGGTANSAAGAGGGGGGGGGGGWSRKVGPASDIGASKAVTIGAGGPGGVAGNNAGSPGGDTSLGALCVGKGGSGGGGNTGSGFATGGNGGVAGTGDVTLTGAGGNPSIVTTPPESNGIGGHAALGFGGRQAIPGTTGTGAIGKEYGGGGAGGQTYNAGGAAAGGAGAAGVVIITEYCSE